MGAWDTSGLDQERDELVRALPEYEIGHVLGRGSFAVVYAARHRQLGRDDAIKRLSSARLRDPGVRKRFATEARTLALLDHPHVVRVHYFVQRGDLGALVMERLHGGTLADRMALGRIPAASSCAIALAALHGLEHAHQQRILHRDVKPANLIFGDGDVLKVADFGIAGVVDADAARAAVTTGALGTPAYMAPEQVSRKVGSPSPKTDIWAVGAVLYELLAGTPPFDSDGDLSEILRERIENEVPPLRERAPDVPAEIAAVVMRALRRAPDQRYETAAEFAAQLEAAVERAYGAQAVARAGVSLWPTAAVPRAYRTEIEPVGDTRALPSASQPHVARPALWQRKRAIVVALMAVVVLAGVGAGLIFGSGNGAHPGSDKARPVAGALTALPSGWPRTMALGGYVDVRDGNRGVARRVGPGGLAFGEFGKTPVGAGAGSPARFARDARTRGLVPWALYYGIRRLGRGNSRGDVTDEQLPSTLADVRLMRSYWLRVRKFLSSLAGGGVTAVAVEQSVWPAIESRQWKHLGSANPPVSVASSGLRELRGLPNDFRGFARAWLALRQRYAPRVLLGWDTADYGAGHDLAKDPLSRADASQLGRRAAAYFAGLGHPFDFAALDIAFTEEGVARPDPPYSAAEKELVLSFVRAFVTASHVPVVLRKVPLGNTRMRTMTDTSYHWKSTWVQWLTDGAFRNLRRLRGAGVIGVQFGVAINPSEGTCPCDAKSDRVTNGGAGGRTATSADDDGGFFAARMRALRDLGGIALLR